MDLQQISHDTAALPPEMFITDGDFAASSCTDPTMQLLAHSLLPVDQAEAVLQGYYTDALHAALLKRLAELRGGAGRGLPREAPQPLQTWRLKRVYEFVEANLGGTISLAALAETARLSRMHFAAQFRAATGVRPHSYVVSRRIHQAKTLLAESDMPIVEIAFEVGYQTQSHFTTVFKNAVGISPHRWRGLNDRRTARTDSRAVANRPAPATAPARA